MNTSHNQGQALIIVLFIIAGLLAFSVSLGDSANMVVNRIKLQNLADGSALSSGDAIADGLNLIAVTNGILIDAGISVFFSGGSTIKWVRSIQRLQDQIIKVTPRAAVIRSNTFGLGDKLYFLGFVTKAPEMRVSRKYLKIWFIKKIPLWCKDSKRIDRRETVVTWMFNGEREWITRARSRPTGGRLIGKYGFWPLPSPNYKAYLVNST